jgi:hypothetical protein
MPSNLHFIVAAYAALWIAVGGFRIFLAGRRREARELARKEAEL